MDRIRSRRACSRTVSARKLLKIVIPGIRVGPSERCDRSINSALTRSAAGLINVALNALVSTG